MKTNISVTDVGTGSHASYEAGKLTVTQSGGCPVEALLAKIDMANMANEDLDDLASEILDVWCAGYDGDPAENGLTVEVTRGEETGVARA